MSGQDRTVLAFMAHPDDIEFLAAGTLVRLHREAGCRIALATVTSGDCGSVDHRPEQIQRIRYEEAKASAAVLDAEYHCVGALDLLIQYDAPTLRRCTEIIRRVRPAIVITNSPQDYMVDHEITSQLVRTACFGAPIPNFFTLDANPAERLDHVPYLYYADPIEGADSFGQPVEPGFLVDISNAIDQKERMLACHASQREWLRAHHGVDQYIISMKQWSAKRGQQIGVAYAEGFRQHLGHAYPHDNILAELLGSS